MGRKQFPLVKGVKSRCDRKENNLVLSLQEEASSTMQVIDLKVIANVYLRCSTAAGRELWLASRPAARFSWQSADGFYSTQNSEEPNVDL